MAHFALKHLKEQNYFPVRVILSPSHDDYASTKPGFVPFKHRVVMCTLACASSEEMVCDPWEGSQPHFIDYTGVVQHFALENENESVFFLCGEDHFKKCVQYDGVEFINRTIVVPRDKTSMSSTIARKMKSKDDLSHVVPNEHVLEYIANNHLYTL